MKFRVFIFLLILCFCFVPASAKAKSDAEAGKSYAKLAHESFKDKDYLKAGKLYEKAYESFKLKIYLENSIIAYLHYAFDALNEKKFDRAIKYCKKVLSLEPDNEDAKEILADVYYSRGSEFYYRGKEYQAEKDLNKSLKYSVLAEQKERAERLLSKISGQRGDLFNISKPFVKKTSASAGPIPEMLELMELKIYGETFEKLPMTRRVSRLEKDVFGGVFKENGLLDRIKKLKERVLPELID